MRGIKLKAVVKYHNKILNVSSIDFTGEMALLNDGMLDGYFSFDEINFIQFTGFLDKNGEEIYEGSIVKYNGRKTESRSKMTVEWKDGGYTLNAFEESWCYDLGSCLESTLEVIGNIYENPELLNA